MIDVLQLQTRTIRYEFADGVRDFQQALWILVMGVYAWLVWDTSSLWVSSFVEFIRLQEPLFGLLIVFTIAIGIPVLITQGILQLMNEYLRRRWLWRKTGIVKPKAWLVPRRVLFIAMVINLAVILIGIYIALQLNNLGIILRSLYVGVGLGYAYMYWVQGKRLQLERYRPVAVVGLIGTLLIALLPLTAGLSCLVISLFWAVLLVTSGGYGVHQVFLENQDLPDEA
jgi:hypothetical protein